MAGTPEQHIWVLRNKLETATSALEEETRQKSEIKTASEQLKEDLRKQKEAYAKLDKHAKNCEKATNKAQKDVKNAKGYSDHVINSQKGNLRSAERRAEEATRDLKAWRDKYGFSVEKPAEEKYALQMSVSEWQSKAEKARNQIASLEEQIQGTPTQMGLHQALEEWEEHQGCSEEFATLEDKVHELKEELAASKEKYQKAKSDMKPIQKKADQLEQAKTALQELQNKADQLEQAKTALQELQDKANQLYQAFQELQNKASELEQANKALQDQDKTQDYILHIQKLESDLEQHQKTEGEMKVLQEKVQHLEQALHDQEKTDIHMPDDDVLHRERLESDLKALQDRHQKTESEMDALQEKAGRLEEANKAFQDEDDSRKDILQKLNSDLTTTKEQLQTTESDLEALQEKAGQLEESNRAFQDQDQVPDSDAPTVGEMADQVEALAGVIDQLESELKETKEGLQKKKTDMDGLKENVYQLEQANKVFQEKEDERLLAEFLEEEKPRVIEERTQLMAQTKTSKKPEQDMETLQLRLETPEKAKHSQVSSSAHIMGSSPSYPSQRRLLTYANILSQVTPPSSPIYTTDEGSQDLEKTPRPKKSLRQDLGYSSRDQSDGEQPDLFMSPQEGAMMSKQAEIGEEKKEVGAETWQTDSSEDDGERAKGSMRLSTKWSLPLRRPRKDLEIHDLQAMERTKEHSEVLENLFECTPAKANAIDRRLKALGPGCRLHEAPAIVAYELSEIPEDTYKGLASGQLIATIPPNKVKDAGTSPDKFTHDMSTDNQDLPAKDVGGPILIAKDMTTDTTGLYTEGVKVPHTKSSRRTSLLYILTFLMILFGLFCLYVGLKPDPKLTTQHGIMYKNIYSHRHTPFPTPSLYASTPITFVYPPTPALQLGLGRMMTGSSLGGRLKGQW